MSLSNPNKVVTEERLNEYHNTILPYLGGMPEILANKFSKSDLYSTTEKIVGQWTDGKPLYQKVVQVGALTNTTTSVNKTVNIGAAVDKFVKIEAYGNYGNGTVPLAYTSNMNDFTILPVGCDNSDPNSANTVGIQYNGQLSWITDTFIIAQYTKTTDSAVAIGTDTDYSTTEKIIGTWIDGKPLYQKTYTYTFTSSASIVEVGDLPANLDKIINISGARCFATGGYSFGTYYCNENDYAIPYTNNGKLSIVGQGQNGFTHYITIQYTKTT